MNRLQVANNLSQQIQLLNQQDLLRLRLFIDELIQRRNTQEEVQKTSQPPAPPTFLSNLRTLNIPGGKSSFTRALIYDDLAI